jgi:formate dehydrogenase assembly factor FdhD
MANITMKIDEASCSVCKAEFFKKDLDETGRCPECVKHNLVPGFKVEQDFVKQDKSVSRAEIEKIVREVLIKIELEKEEKKREEADEQAGNFSAKICKICGKEFIPRAPAQQRCQECLDSAKK